MPEDRLYYDLKYLTIFVVESFVYEINWHTKIVFPAFLCESYIDAENNTIKWKPAKTKKKIKYFYSQ